MRMQTWALVLAVALVVPAFGQIGGRPAAPVLASTRFVTRALNSEVSTGSSCPETSGRLRRAARSPARRRSR